MFDAIHHVAQDKCKAARIKHKDAIFIDDSYRERSKVRDIAGIPTFAPDAIESLMDWRR